jgi:hypothetical protein
MAIKPAPCHANFTAFAALASTRPTQRGPPATTESVEPGVGVTLPPSVVPPFDEPPFDEPPLDEPPFDEPPLDEPPLDEPPFAAPPLEVLPPFAVPPLEVLPPFDEPPFAAPPAAEDPTVESHPPPAALFAPEPLEHAQASKVAEGANRKITRRRMDQDSFVTA